MGTRLKQGLNERDLEQLSRVNYISGVSPTVSGKTSLVYNRNVKTGVSVQGKNEVYFKKEKDNLARGRGINSPVYHYGLDNYTRSGLFGSSRYDLWFCSRKKSE